MRLVLALVLMFACLTGARADTTTDAIRTTLQTLTRERMALSGQVSELEQKLSETRNNYVSALAAKDTDVKDPLVGWLVHGGTLQDAWLETVARQEQNKMDAALLAELSQRTADLKAAQNALDEKTAEIHTIETQLADRVLSKDETETMRALLAAIANPAQAQAKGGSVVIFPMSGTARLLDSHHLEIAPPSTGGRQAVRAPADGTVAFSGKLGAFGHATVITTASHTSIAILRQNDSVVSTGDTVTAGQLVGFADAAIALYGTGNALSDLYKADATQ